MVASISVPISIITNNCTVLVLVKANSLREYSFQVLIRKTHGQNQSQTLWQVVLEDPTIDVSSGPD